MKQGWKWVNRTLCVLLTFVLAAVLFAASTVSLVALLLKNSGFHGLVAGDGDVLDRQMTRIEVKVRKLAEKTAFDPAAVLAAVTRADVAAYGRKATAWWMQLYLSNPSLLAPVVELPALEAALENDSVFRATQKDTTYKGVIREELAPKIGQIVRETVLPLRTELISFGLSKLLDRIDVVRYVNLLDWVPLALWAAAFLLGDLMMLLRCRSGREGWLYVGWSMSAAGIAFLALLMALSSWQLPDLLRQANGLLGMQGDLLMRNLLVLGACCTLAMVGVGSWLVHFSAAGKENHGHRTENHPL